MTFDLRLDVNLDDSRSEIKNQQSKIKNSLAEGTGVEPASDRGAVVFGTTALPVRLPFLKKTCFEL